MSPIAVSSDPPTAPTLKLTLAQGRPPPPVELVRSIISALQPPMMEGIDSTTLGMTGAIGGSNDTLVTDIVLQLLHGDPVTTAHLALSTFARSVTNLQCSVSSLIDRIDQQLLTVQPLTLRGVCTSK